MAYITYVNWGDLKRGYNKNVGNVVRQFGAYPNQFLSALLQYMHEIPKEEYRNLMLPKDKQLYGVDATGSAPTGCHTITKFMSQEIPQPFIRQRSNDIKYIKSLASGFATYRSNNNNKKCAIFLFSTMYVMYNSINPNAEVDFADLFDPMDKVKECLAQVNYADIFDLTEKAIKSLAKGAKITLKTRIGVPDRLLKFVKEGRSCGTDITRVILEEKQAESKARRDRTKKLREIGKRPAFSEEKIVASVVAEMDKQAKLVEEETRGLVDAEVLAQDARLIVAAETENLDTIHESVNDALLVSSFMKVMRSIHSTSCPELGFRSYLNDVVSQTKEKLGVTTDVGVIDGLAYFDHFKKIDNVRLQREKEAGMVSPHAPDTNVPAFDCEDRPPMPSVTYELETTRFLEFLEEVDTAPVELDSSSDTTSPSLNRNIATESVDVSITLETAGPSGTQSKEKSGESKREKNKRSSKRKLNLDKVPVAAKKIRTFRPLSTNPKAVRQRIERAQRKRETQMKAIFGDDTRVEPPPCDSHDSDE